MYVLRKCPALVNEMINILSQLVASAVARQRKSGDIRIKCHTFTYWLIKQPQHIFFYIYIPIYSKPMQT